MKTVQTTAYAKINLFLDVSAKREDGYHDLVSVMQSVSLSDTLSFYLTDSEETLLFCNDVGLTCDKDNLVIRAIDAFRGATGVAKGVTVRLDKKIPYAAGLGGGSADAAAALRGMNLLCGAPLTTDDLCRIAKDLGADVPFCVKGGCAVAEGIGDILQPIDGFSGVYFVIVKGQNGVSTPDAFARLDEKFGDYSHRPVCDPSALLSGIKRGHRGEAIRGMYNIFEAISGADELQIAGIKQTLAEYGALGALMSGSGPSVFGVFESRQTAGKAVATLKKAGFFAALCSAVPPLS